jgi:hypothetical protein
MPATTDVSQDESGCRALAAKAIVGVACQSILVLPPETRYSDELVGRAFAPLAAALDRTWAAAQWPGRALGARPDVRDRRATIRWYEALVVTHSIVPPPAFSELLMRNVSREPAIVRLMRRLGRADEDGETVEEMEELDAVAAILDPVLLPHLESAVDLFVDHHCACTVGFEALARAHGLIDDDAEDEIRERRRLARELLGPVLGIALPDGRTCPERATIPGVWQALERSSGVPWKTPNGGLASIVFQAMLGHSLSGVRAARCSGAIVGGLLHWYFVHVGGFEFHVGKPVAHVRCPKGGASTAADDPCKTVLRLSTGRGWVPRCPVCHDWFDFRTHALVETRGNLVGTLHRHEDDGLPARPHQFAGNTPQIVEIWACARCCGDSALAGILERRIQALAALRSGGKEALQAVAPKGGLGHEIDELQRLIGPKRGRRGPARLGPKEEGKLRAIVGPRLAPLKTRFPEIVSTFVDLFVEYWRLRRELSRERHFIPPDPAHPDDMPRTWPCPLRETLREGDPGAEVHGQPASERLTTLWFCIVKEEGEAVGESREASCAPTTSKRSPSVALMRAVVSQYASHRGESGPRLVFKAMGLDERTSDDRGVIRAVAQRFMNFRTFVARADGDLPRFEKLAESEVQALWTKLAGIPDLPFANERDLVRTLAKLLKEVADLESEGVL